MRTVNIIGAGPVGCYLGYLLSDDFKVRVFEEHEEVGKPVQCAGIVTSVIDLPSEVIVRRVKDFKIEFKGKSLSVKLNKPDLVIDREKLDKYYFRKAKDNGVEFYFGYRLVKIEGELKFSNGESFEKDILVGADGPNSLVSKFLGNEDESYLGIQKRVKCDDDKVVVDLGYGKFGWSIPEKSFCRVGVMDEVSRCKESFGKFVGGKVEVSGLIPKYNRKKIFSSGDCYVVGDAASLVKETTGGGIVQGLESASILSECIKDGKDYKRSLRRVRREVRLHHLVRRFLDVLGEKDILKIIEIMGKERNKKILESGSRDKFIKMVLNLLWKEPYLIKICVLNIPKLYKEIFLRG